MFGAKVVLTVVVAEALVVGAVVNGVEAFVSLPVLLDTEAVRGSISATKHAVSNSTVSPL